MSKDIYSIQRTLNEILDIEPEEYTIPDSELFDCSDYPNVGKCSGRFSWRGIKQTDNHISQRIEAYKKTCRERRGYKQTDEHKRKREKAIANRTPEQKAETQRKRIESWKRTMAKKTSEELAEQSRNRVRGYKKACVKRNEEN